MDNQDLSLNEVLARLKRGLLPALATSLALAAVTFTLSSRQDPVYQASSTVLATQSEQGVRGLDVSLATAPRIDGPAYEAAAYSTPVREDARARLDDPAMIERTSVSVAVQPGFISNLVRITARGGDPRDAQAVADAVAGALVAWDESRAARIIERALGRLESQLEVLDRQIVALGASDSPSLLAQRDDLLLIRSQRLTELNLARTLQNSAAGSLELLEPASLPRSPVAPNPRRNAAVALVLGLLLGFASSSLRDALDTRLRTTEALKRATGLPIIAEIPSAAWRAPPLLNEAVSFLHSALSFYRPTLRPEVILIARAARAAQAEQDFALALSLGKSFARNEERVLLIDADLRAPASAAALGLADPTVIPLQTYLNDPATPLQPVALKVDAARRLQVVPSLRAALSPGDLLRVGIQDCLERWKTQFDVIIITSPPLLGSADPLVLMPLADTLLLTTDLRRAEHKDVQACADLAKRSNVGFVALVPTTDRRPQAPVAIQAEPALPVAVAKRPAELEQERLAR